MPTFETISGPTIVLKAEWRKCRRKLPTLRELNEMLRRTRKQRHADARQNCRRLTGRDSI